MKTARFRFLGVAATLLVAAFALCPPTRAETDAAAQRFVVKLWPGSPPGARVDPAYKEIVTYRDSNPDKPSYRQVTEPALEVFLPSAGKATGTAMVICPGGSYAGLAYDHEGIQVARWCNELGIAGIILKYRLPSDAIMENKSVGPLQDVQEAIRTVRRRAQEWHVDPARVGIIGFSAGGSLAATASTMFDERVYEPADAVNARPDFSILVYPVISMQAGVTHPGSRKNLLGPDPDAALVDRFSADQRVGPQTPPAFLVHSADDAVVPIENSIRYFLALKKNGVAGELHAYPQGGHGYGLGIKPDSPTRWTEVLKVWLQTNGW